MVFDILRQKFMFNSHAGGMAVARPNGFEIGFEILWETLFLDQLQRRQYLTPPAWVLITK